ncbi:hypothetical protein LshimejAT787_2200750 [Lyophyllum shimeji]|uniref:Uncharacterized protein n=1 Tax=Lyophyllum shimeji TaxID=47721 RepID=A0A9P3PYI1_LYOSH|nr:hypothetical protein LshimejAT787_2200750 [Lyophyllum shimeji]
MLGLATMLGEAGSDVGEVTLLRAGTSSSMDEGMEWEAGGWEAGMEGGAGDDGEAWTDEQNQDHRGGQQRHIISHRSVGRAAVANEIAVED